ncbi:PIN domain-containing protein [candidate division KSB1 bacterium]|nr:PIN domain-containing protein [candidate division KSB1 bacterium]
MTSMKDKIFIDTNILVYANDRSDAFRREKSKQALYEGLVNGNLVVSTQVLGEFYVTVTRKIKVPLSTDIAQKQIQLLRSIEIVEIDFHLVLQAIDLSNRHLISYWDSLILAAAQKAKCMTIYSEDLNPGQIIESIVVLNPFLTPSGQ